MLHLHSSTHSPGDLLLSGSKQQPIMFNQELRFKIRLKTVNSSTLLAFTMEHPTIPHEASALPPEPSPASTQTSTASHGLCPHSNHAQLLLADEPSTRLYSTFSTHSLSQLSPACRQIATSPNLSNTCKCLNTKADVSGT